MSRARLIAAVSAALFLRWLAVGRVTMTVAGTTVTIPALAITAVCLITVTAAVVALAVCRLQAELAMHVAWQVPKAAAR